MTNPLHWLVGYWRWSTSGSMWRFFVQIGAPLVVLIIVIALRIVDV